MLRTASVALVIAASAVVVIAGSALAADPAPNPPPGTVYVAPTSVSGGSSSQPGSGTSVSTGQAAATSDSQGQAAQHCGVQAGAGSTGYSAQPTRISGAGTSSPTCSTSSGGGTAPAGNGQTTTGSTTAARDLAGGGAGRAEARTKPSIGGSLAPKALGGVHSGQGLAGGLLWFGLLLLLALLFLLIGFAAGRRRRAQAAA